MSILAAAWSRVSASLGAAVIVIGMMAAPLVAVAAPYADMVIDARTGEVLHATNADARLHPASLTKMMTLYVAFEAIKRGEISLDTRVTVSANAASEPPSKLGLRAGQKIALRFLIRAAAVRSANDAATAIGEAISGSESAFAERMTRTARALGMNNTTFRNAHGLTQSGHLSTARDMTVMGRRLFYDHPEYYNLFSRRSTDAGGSIVYNTNRRFLDAYPGADGIKTGFTNAAGFNLVGSAERGNKRIIATVFGGTSTPQRNAKMAELLDLGFARAPNNAPLRMPAPPDYSTPTLLADGRMPAGKTIRVVRAVATSPRPAARPVATAVPDAVLAALQTGIEAALGDALTSDTARAAGSAVATVADPDVADPGAAALPPDDTESAQAGLAVATAAAEDLPLALADAETLALAVSDVDALTAALEPEPTPEREPDSIAAPVAVAAAPLPPRARQAAPPRTRVALPETAPDTVTAADALAAASTADTAPADADALPGLATTSAPPPRPEAIRTAAVADETEGAILLASINSDAPVVAPAPRPEIVTRMSTSGGRYWGINIGRFGTRDAAERALLAVALAESRALGKGLRRVIRQSGGFDAQFAGLSQAEADLACRRLQALDRTCFTVSP